MNLLKRIENDIKETSAQMHALSRRNNVLREAATKLRNGGERMESRVLAEIASQDVLLDFWSEVER